MFTATVINFLVSSLRTGTQVALFIVLIRKALILDTDYPLSEKRGTVNKALRNTNIVVRLWVTNIPVSIKLSLSDPGY